MALETGCWIDGHWGVYAPLRMIDIARSYGFQLDDMAEVAMKSYEEGEYEFLYEGEFYDAFEFVAGQGSLCDEAQEWLDENVAEEGYDFGWSDGEFFYMPYEWWAEGEDCTCNEGVGDEAFICKRCGVNTLEISEYYMVNDIVWLQANGALNVIDDDAQGMLCIGCLEIWLGRRLLPDDFTECPLNSRDYGKSERLMNRLGF